MPRKIKSYGRADLIGVALPNHASTYTVISHESVMDLSAQALQDAGFSITSENYRATHDGNIASAIYTLNFGDDPELSMMFAWSNSYNKQMRFKCGIGAIHKLNNTSLVCGDMGSWARKHTGSADTETKETIEAQIKLAKLYYTQLVSDKEAMKNINLDTRKQAQLLGMLFAEHDILTTEQASMIKQQMFRATYKSTHPGSLWEFYNFVTLALQQSHPKTWMEDQRVLHWFISDTFKFNKVDVDTTIEVLTEPVDPDQVDLEDMIAEVEAENNELTGGGDDDDDEPVDDSPEITGIPDGDKLSDTDDEFDANAEMQEMKTEEIIEEREEDDEYTEISYEEAEEHVANQIKEDENPIPEVTDAEAEELIKGQEAVDQQVALEHAATQPEEDLGDADFDLALASDDDDDEDVESGDIDFGFA